LRDGDVLPRPSQMRLLVAVLWRYWQLRLAPDPKWKGADSSIFLKESVETDEQTGYRIEKVDYDADPGCTKDRVRTRKRFRSAGPELWELVLYGRRIKAKTQKGWD